MNNVGLTQAEVEAILSEGIKAGEGIDAEKLKTAIAKAIVANNEKIRKHEQESMNELRNLVKSHKT